MAAAPHGCPSYVGEPCSNVCAASCPPQQLHDNRWLRWLGPWLHQPALWRWSRRGVALGVALGLFFGLLIPIAQIPLSAAAAVVLRANLPAAAASTLITNPVTFGPIYYGAHKLGAWITGEKTLPTAPKAMEEAVFHEDASLIERIKVPGQPLLVGLALIATLMGVLSYVVISLIWRWRVMRRRRDRQRAVERRL
ncbi:MAG: DUF2062 domain-containing protein [Halothiobacillaceae bacterium]